MPENNNPNTGDGPSLLNEILSTGDRIEQETWDFPPPPEADGGLSVSGWDSQAPLQGQSPAPVKKKKVAMKPRDFLKLIGALLLVSLIFFGAFLAYIVFNPGQAQFFLSFGINPGDISSLLQRLTNGIFGAATFFLSVVWIIVLFRAILTKKEYKKKKTIAIFLSFFVGISLFSEITLWAFLVQKINATDYQNPNGGVLIYDNDKLLSERFKSSAELHNFNNLIGPLELKFDLKSDANFVGKLMDIEDFEVSIPDAYKRNNKTNEYTDPCIIKRASPQDDQGIICMFKDAKSYKPTGVYNGTDKVTRKPRSIPIVFPVINIAGSVDVKASDRAVTYDASDLSSLGNIAWYTEKNTTTPISTDKVYSIALSKEEQILCLSVFAKDNCDKIFIVPSEEESSISAKITYERDGLNDRKYRFELQNLEIKSGEITEYSWFVNNEPQRCSEEVCEIEFPEYGNKKISVEIGDSAGKTTRVETALSVSHSLELKKASRTKSLLKVTSDDGRSIIDDSFDSSLNAYFVSDINLPVMLTFDATDVGVKNYGYELQGVEWTFDGTKKSGQKVQYELINEKRYTIVAQYTFASPEKKQSEVIEEKIIIEPKKKDIAISLKLTQDSEYAPATVHVDGSASQSKVGTITKFIYDFGEWKGPIEGDAVQDYRYNTPGEYTITFTVVKSDGSKETMSRKIVFKDAPRHVVINSSVYSGIAGKPIDFDTNWTVGQIESYEWDFGDGSRSTEAMPTHIYERTGKYTIKLTAVYTDRRVVEAEKEIEIKD